jgi:hypothetical protein
VRRRPDSGDVGIELILTDDDALDGDPDGGFDGTIEPDASRRRAAVGIVVGVAVVGLLVWQPWAADDAATAPTTTLVSGPVEPVVEVASPVIELDPVPAGFELVRSDSGEEGAVNPGWSEVWATPGAARSEGRWVEVSLLPFQRLSDIADRGGTPVLVGGRSGVISGRVEVELRLSFDPGTPDVQRLVRLTSHGFDRAELVELAASIGVADDRPTYADADLLDGLDVVASGVTGSSLIAEALDAADRVGSVRYAAAAGQDVVVVQLTADTPDAMILLDLASDPLEPVSGAALPDGVRLGARVNDAGGLRTATWVADGQRITVITTLSLRQLETVVLPAVRIVLEP